MSLLSSDAWRNFGCYAALTLSNVLKEANSGTSDSHHLICQEWSQRLPGIVYTNKLNMPGTILGAEAKLVEVLLNSLSLWNRSICTWTAHQEQFLLFLTGSAQEAGWWPEPKPPPGTNMAISPSGQLHFGVPGRGVPLYFHHTRSGGAWG